MSQPRSSPFSGCLASLPAEGLFSVWLGPVDGPPDFTREETAPHYAASTMKLPVLITAHHAHDEGRIDLDSRVRVHDDFASAADGSRFRMRQDYDNDDQVWDRIDLDAPLRWLVERMIVRSSNLATNLILEAVGVPAVQQTVCALCLHDSLVSRGIEDAAAREAGLDNLVSARDLARALQSVIGSPEVLATLSRQELRDTLPAGLPPGTRIAHKSGWVEGITHDAGIIFPEGADPFILVVCTTSGLSEAEGRDLIAHAANAAWQERGLPG
ncbi:MAG: class A beta-lactamase-related serine hydrolase [Nocardioides sp.]|nr:class A beta-lactamase-related serine hydrolase [Nocardioides sp.]